MFIPFLIFPVPFIVYPTGVNSTLLITATLGVVPSVPLPKYKLASVDFYLGYQVHFQF